MRFPKHNAGFTLIELLTVIVIIGLLVSIALPSILEIKRQSMATASRATLRMIEGAINMYSNDFRTGPVTDFAGMRASLPPSSSTAGPYSGWAGRHILVYLLTGYADAGDDHCTGFGMRLVDGGRKYGPYNGTENAPMKKEGTTGPPAFVDAFDNPFCYYRIGPALTYISTDNSGAGPADINAYLKGLYLALRGLTGYPRVDYVLCSKGSDGAWGDKDASGKWDPGTDDITNFME